MNQCERIVKYIKDHGSITSLESTNKLFIMSLHRRISDLEELGYEFKKEQVCKTNSDGEKIYFKRYTIIKENN